MSWDEPAVGRRVVRIWDATCMKALQKDVDDKKAERETLLYVGYIRYVCTTILSIPRMQIFEYILAFVCVCLFAPAISTLQFDRLNIFHCFQQKGHVSQ